MQTWLDIWEQLLLLNGSLMLFVLGALAVCTAIELVAPAEQGQGWKARARNLVFMLVFNLLGLAGIAAWYAYGPSPSLDRQAPALFSAATLVIANLFAIDLLYYWYHRAQHRFPMLWAIHELHHADTELNATTSFRTYWLEAPIQTILVMTPILLVFGDLGPDHELAVFVGANFFLLFSHCNFRLSLGPLTSILCGPQLHRIHHSRLPEHQNTNFAQYFPLLDRIFGTYHAPADDEYPPTGAEGLASNAPFWLAMLQPFTIWAESLGFSVAARGVSVTPVARSRTDRANRERKRKKKRRDR